MTLALDEAAISVADGDFGGADGFARKRLPPAIAAPEVLRYYDTGRDYLAGSQRAQGRAGPGQPRTLDLPAAMTATTARDLIERVARKTDWSRDTLLWRTAELDANIAPGMIVTVPGQSALWRVDEWEWRDTGVELSLTRVVPTGVDVALPLAADAGRANAIPDLVAAPTLLTAFELPWDGAGSGDTPVIAAAVSSASPGWKGAALFLDRGDGNLVPLGPSGRNRAVVGVAQSILPVRSPLLIDRTSMLAVKLADDAMNLANAHGRQIAAGVNRALVGEEIIQFANAAPCGGGIWQLTGLLRGRGGTETKVAGHLADERFVLLNDMVIGLDGGLIGNGSATIIAEGLGDPLPITSSVRLRGLTNRPLSPVHGVMTVLADGSRLLAWTRRARGAWTWDDGVDAPLHEEVEAYLVTFGDIDAPSSMWSVSEPRLALDAAALSRLRTADPTGELQVRQQGSYALSEPLRLGTLA